MNVTEFFLQLITYRNCEDRTIISVAPLYHLYRTLGEFNNLTNERNFDRGLNHGWRIAVLGVPREKEVKEDQE